MRQIIDEEDEQFASNLSKRVEEIMEKEEWLSNWELANAVGHKINSDSVTAARRAMRSRGWVIEKRVNPNPKTGRYQYRVKPEGNTFSKFF